MKKRNYIAYFVALTLLFGQVFSVGVYAEEVAGQLPQSEILTEDTEAEQLEQLEAIRSEENAPTEMPMNISDFVEKLDASEADDFQKLVQIFDTIAVPDASERIGICIYIPQNETKQRLLQTQKMYLTALSTVEQENESLFSAVVTEAMLDELEALEDIVVFIDAKYDTLDEDEYLQQLLEWQTGALPGYPNLAPGEVVMDELEPRVDYPEWWPRNPETGEPVAEPATGFVYAGIKPEFIPKLYKTRLDSSLENQVSSMSGSSTVDIYATYRFYDYNDYDGLYNKLMQMFGNETSIEQIQERLAYKITATPSMIEILDRIDEISSLYSEEFFYDTSDSIDSFLVVEEYDSADVVDMALINQNYLDEEGITKARNDFGVSGRNATIAIIDSGINPYHVAFRGKSIRFIDFGIPGNTQYRDPGGHGTSVASVIYEYAPNVDIIVLCVADSQGGYSPSATNEALRFVENNRNAIDLVNMSIRGENRDVINRITSLNASLLPVFVSAGNSEGEQLQAPLNSLNPYGHSTYGISNIKSPVNYLVANPKPRDLGYGPHFTSARSSAHFVLDDEIAVLILGFGFIGTNIRVANGRDDYSYSIATGSSFSSAAAAGTYALAVEASKRSGTRIINIPFIDYGYPGFDPIYGNGLIYAYRLIQNASGLSNDHNYYYLKDYLTYNVGAVLQPGFTAQIQVYKPYPKIYHAINITACVLSGNSPAIEIGYYDSNGQHSLNTGWVQTDMVLETNEDVIIYMKNISNERYIASMDITLSH